MSNESTANEKPVLLLTGARKGIGRNLAEHYLAKGWTVIGCSRTESDLEHPDYAHFCVDVADEPAVKKLFGKVRKQYGRLDALINNAGAASMNHFLLTPRATYDRLFETNVAGTFLFCREAAKQMQRRRYGRIINFSTVAVPLKLGGEAVYVASKAAVTSLTQVLAKELGPFNITVNAIGPTPISTDLIRGVPKDKIDALVEQQSIHRLGEFRDVANLADFFLQPESDFITGQVVYLGGC